MHLATLLQIYEKRYGIQISFEVCHPALYRVEPLLLGMKQYQHHSPVCIFHKSCDNSRRCADSKNRALKVIQDGRSRGRLCRFGVWEYVVPVMHDKLLLGALFLGTFSAKGRPMRLPPGVAKPPAITPEKRGELKRISAFLVEYIKLEISQSDLESQLFGQLHNERFYSESCRDFIEQHFQENIALADLAERLGVNPNYLGGLLRRVHGTTFRQLLTERRLKEAKVWLETRDQCKVAEIAYSCGFQDSNYFSLIFRRYTGMTPLKYRRQFRPDANLPS
jgi:AraC-like DNA-binding protein